MENSPMHAQPNEALIQRTPIPGYFCPSRRVLDVGCSGLRAKNDYAGNGGLITGGGLAGWGDGTGGGVIVRAVGSGSGVAPITFGSILDGTSFTVLAGEKRLHPSYIGQCTCSDNEGWTSGFDWDVIRWGDNPPQRDLTGTNCDDRFGSLHPRGASIVMCDVSVRLVNFNVA